MEQIHGETFQLTNQTNKQTNKKYLLLFFSQKWPRTPNKWKVGYYGRYKIFAEAALSFIHFTHLPRMHIHTNHIGSFFQNTATRYIGLHLPLTVANEWKRLGICCIGGCTTHNDWQIKESFITLRLPPESDPTRHGFNLEKGTEMVGSAKAEKEKGGMKKTCIPPPPHISKHV